jgi:hypothetical protein
VPTVHISSVGMRSIDGFNPVPDLSAAKLVSSDVIMTE